MKKLQNKKSQTKRIYLDFAAQTMPSQKVLLEMEKIQSQNFNPSSIYSEGMMAENILQNSRDKISRILGVRNQEIYFTSNSTLSCATAILGTVSFYKESPSQSKTTANQRNKKYILPHIITSNIEHAAVLENVKFLERMGEIEVSYIAADEEGIISVADVIKEIKDNTILISIIYANNEVGTIQDLKNISKGIQEWKKKNQKDIEDNFNYPYFHTDASQAGNYLSLNVQTLGVDLLSLNGSKIYGPKSSALLLKKENINLSPIYFGGGQERNLFSGTVDVEKCWGLAVALEEAQKKIKLEKNGKNNNKKFLEKLSVKRNNLWKKISEKIPEAKLIGAWNDNNWRENKKDILREERIAKRLPNNLSIWLPDFPSDEMVIRLDQRGFAISAGSACSAQESEFSQVIFNIMKNKYSSEQAKKIARETIRITIDDQIKEKDLEKFMKVLKEIYFKFKV